MILADEISGRVQQHYSDPLAEPLLLSALGEMLRDAGLWPSGDNRPLTQVIDDDVEKVSYRPDPAASGYVVVVPRGEEAIAERAFERRRLQKLLRSLPKALLLAFCIKTDEAVFVRIDPSPLKYALGAPSDDSRWILIGPEYRMPGVFVADDRSLPKDEAQELLEKLRAWAEKEGVDLFDLARRPSPAPKSAPISAPSSNALERLYAAQSEELRDKLFVPVDIALLLSRQP